MCSAASSATYSAASSHHRAHELCSSRGAVELVHMRKAGGTTIGENLCRHCDPPKPLMARIDGENAEAGGQFQSTRSFPFGTTFYLQFKSYSEKARKASPSEHTSRPPGESEAAAKWSSYRWNVGYCRERDLASGQRGEPERGVGRA